MEYALQMIANFNLIELFKLDVGKLKIFIAEACKRYNEVKFHNFKHGWSVMHMSYLLLRNGASKYLTSLDILPVLVGCLCHDLDHPGTNNTFEVVSHTERALAYSYDSVLERHHSSLTHRLLKSTDCCILENLSSSDQMYVHVAITDIILATDMRYHYTLVKELESASQNTPPFDVSSQTSRRELMKCMAHAADISSQQLPFELAKVWSDRCIAEFINQAEEEKLNGYPVTPFMTDLDTKEQQCRAQMGFITHVVSPLWSAVAVCFPAVLERCDQLKQNHDQYAEMAGANDDASSSL